MARRQAWILGVLAAAAAACVPGPGPCCLAAARGRVVDRDTGAPIRDAVVIEWWRGAGRMGGPQPTRHARFARTDASGRFAFARELAPSPRLWLEKTYGPAYGFQHPDYGLVRAGDAGEGSGEVVLEGSTHDAAARRLDLDVLCQSPKREAWEQELARLACPAPSPSRRAIER
jgi:hypothetical protein